MKNNAESEHKKRLLLMGSSAFNASELPAEVRKGIDEAIEQDMQIIVGEASGASRLFQDYLKAKNYRNVVVGHALRMRYNAGNWPTFQYGKNLKERERNMIQDCHSAMIIWMNQSGVIAENLELLKRLGKPTYLYECSTEDGRVNAGQLDLKRVYDPFYQMKEYYRKQKEARSKG